MPVRIAASLALGLLAAAAAAQPSADSLNQQDAQGRKQGPWQRTWYQSSQLRYSGQFKDGKPVGGFVYYSTKGTVESRIDHYPGSNASHARHYRPSGKLMAEGRYVDQAKDSTWNYFGDDGSLNSTEHWINGKKDGEQLIFFPNGKITERMTFTKGVQTGKKELYYADGTLRYEANYVNGEPEGQEAFYFRDGKKEIQGKYVNGFRDGVWMYWNTDGSLQMQVLYDRGKSVKQQYENGTFTDYYDDQQKKSVVAYKNGRREGPFTEWYDNGTWTKVPVELGPKGEQMADEERKLEGQAKKREGHYVHDQLDGTVKTYDEAGKLTSSKEYVHGAAAAEGAPARPSMDPATNP